MGEYAGVPGRPAGFRYPHRLYRVYIFDLDGTVYLGDQLLPTARDTILALRDAGCSTLFLSNNPTHTREDYASKLTQLGLPTDPGSVVTSGLVLVDFLRQRMPGARLFVLGEAPLCGELERAGFRLVDRPDEVDAVIASFDRTFVYRKLQIAFDAIRRGARFFATNADRFCPVPGGGEPDAASTIAAVEACTGVSVETVVGKPSEHMAQAILRLAHASPGDCLITGDRLETDVFLGLRAGMDAALVLTGATNVEVLAASRIRPTYVLDRLADLLRPATVNVNAALDSTATLPGDTPTT